VPGVLLILTFVLTHEDHPANHGSVFRQPDDFAFLVSFFHGISNNQSLDISSTRAKSPFRHNLAEQAIQVSPVFGLIAETSARLYRK